MGDDPTRDSEPARTSSATLMSGESKSWDAGDLIRGTVDELRQVLDAKHVISEPMIFGNTTVVPLVSVGFGFGAGGGGGGGKSSDGERGEGGGGGGGGGGGVKPIAVLVIEDGSVRLEPIPEAPSGLERLGAAVAGVLEQRAEKAGSKDDD